MSTIGWLGSLRSVGAPSHEGGDALDERCAREAAAQNLKRLRRAVRRHHGEQRAHGFDPAFEIRIIGLGRVVGRHVASPKTVSD
jgi:hypothetical protein